jgi:hypothetical protein
MEILMDNQLCDVSSTNPCGPARFMGTWPAPFAARFRGGGEDGALFCEFATDLDVCVRTGLARQMHFINNKETVMHLDQQRKRTEIVEQRKIDAARMQEKAHVCVHMCLCGNLQGGKLKFPGARANHWKFRLNLQEPDFSAAFSIFHLMGIPLPPYCCRLCPVRISRLFTPIHSPGNSRV